MTRQEVNFEILFKLRQFFITNPDIRFFQALQILKLQSTKGSGEIGKDTLFSIPDNFFEESEKTLNKLTNVPS